jgi:hypothetical protein
MNLNELLPQGSLDALSQQLGIPRDQAQRGAEALLPSLLAGMGQKVGDTGTLDSHLDSLGGAGLADNVLNSEPTDVAKGDQLLGGIFGSKDTSRQVAAQASQTSGIDPALLKQMLPILAMLVAGYMAKRSGGQQGGLGSILGSVLGSLAGGQAGASGAGGGGLGGGGLGGALGGGGLGGVLGSILGGSR